MALAKGIYPLYGQIRENTIGSRFHYLGACEMTDLTSKALIAKRYYFGTQRDDLARAMRAMRNSAGPQNKLAARDVCHELIEMHHAMEDSFYRHMLRSVTERAWVN